MGIVYHKKGRYYTLKGKYKNEFGKWVDYERTTPEFQYKKKSDAQHADKLLREELSRKSQTTLKVKMTFAQVSEIYLNQMRSQRKASTIETDIETLRILGDINNMQIDLIKSSTIQKLLNDMDQQDYSISYIKKVYTTIRKIFNYADKERILNENPMDKVVMIKRPNVVKKNEHKFWTPKEFEIFLSVIDEIQYYTIFNFLFHTGCRKGEALALTWEDIDFVRKTFHIDKTCTQDIKGIPFLITPPKTPNSYRTKRMSNHLTDIMKKWYDHQSELYGFNKKCFVFGTLDKPLPTSNLENRFKRYRGYADGWVNAEMMIGCDKPKIGDIIKIKDGEIMNKPNGDRKLRDRTYSDNVIIDSVADDSDSKFPYHVKLPIKDIPIHGLRHSHATLLINNIRNGANIKAIADRLGDTVEQLLKTYAHLFQETEDELIEIIERNT